MNSVVTHKVGNTSKAYAHHVAILRSSGGLPSGKEPLQPISGDKVAQVKKGQIRIFGERPDRNSLWYGKFFFILY